MTYRTMLDTNIVSNLMREPFGRAAGRLAQHGEAGVCVSIVVAAELRFGAAQVEGSGYARRVEATLAALPVLPFDVPADRQYGVLRALLQARGEMIGPNDLLIAAHALALGLTLVTNNTGEFCRVPGLVVEDWLA